MNENNKLHYLYNLIYPLVFLLITVIILSTKNLGANDNIVKYFTFGLTLTSIVLSMIAIFYAIISNTSLFKNIGNLRGAADSINNATKSLDDMSDNLKKDIAEIPELIKGVEKKVDQTKEAMILEKMKSNEIKGESDSEEDIDIDEQNMKKIVNRFVSNASFYGLVVVYTAQLAYKKKLPIHYKEIWENNWIKKEYGLAYFSLMKSLGILNYNKKDNYISITDISEHIPILKESIIEWIKGFEKVDSNNWSNENTKNIISGLVDPIEDYYDMK